MESINPNSSSFPPGIPARLNIPGKLMEPLDRFSLEGEQAKDIPRFIFFFFLFSPGSEFLEHLQQPEESHGHVGIPMELSQIPIELS